MHVGASQVESSKILDGAVMTSKLAEGAVVTSKITDGSVTAAKLAPGAISLEVLFQSISPDGASDAGKVLMFDEAGSVSPMRIRHDASIGSTGMLSIAENAITTLKLADGAVNAPKILDGSVSSAKLADGAVTSDKLLLETLTVQSGPGTNTTVDLLTLLNANRAASMAGMQVRGGSRHWKTTDRAVLPPPYRPSLSSERGRSRRHRSSSGSSTTRTLPGLLTLVSPPLHPTSALCLSRYQAIHQAICSNHFHRPRIAQGRSNTQRFLRLFAPMVLWPVAHGSACCCSGYLGRPDNGLDGRREHALVVRGGVDLGRWGDGAAAESRATIDHHRPACLRPSEPLGSSSTLRSPPLGPTPEGQMITKRSRTRSSEF